ncbi:protein AMN1 homolog isoform X1 [Hyperolius riggenbachi]|uniref:protein AMN1 homolog isoform X1 n=1 Tax=Hyperolius riggenbachi TaxID=752182 RepID=UPI0035A3B08E
MRFSCVFYPEAMYFPTILHPVTSFSCLGPRRMSWFTTEGLLAKIQQHPCLYEKGSEDYKDNQLQHKAWEEIGTDLFDGTWDDLTSKSKASKIADLRRRWKSVRDNYKRELEKQKEEAKSGCRASKRTKYKYVRQMAFLKNVGETGPTEDSILEEDDSSRHSMSEDTQLEGGETESPEVIDIQSSGSSVTMESTSQTQSGAQPPAAKTSTTKKKGKLLKQDYEKQMLSSVQHFVETYKEKTEEKKKRDQQIMEERGKKSPNLQFLISLEPYLDKVPAGLHLSCRKAILEVIEKFIPIESSGDRFGTYSQSLLPPAQTRFQLPQQQVHNPYFLPSIPPMHDSHAPYQSSYESNIGQGRFNFIPSRPIVSTTSLGATTPPTSNRPNVDNANLTTYNILQPIVTATSVSEPQQLGKQSFVSMLSETTE